MMALAIALMMILLAVAIPYCAFRALRALSGEDIEIAELPGDWDREHPWVGTYWEGSVTSLRSKVRLGKIHAWEYEDELATILDRPDAPYCSEVTSRPTYNLWENNTFGPIDTGVPVYTSSRKPPGKVITAYKTDGSAVQIPVENLAKLVQISEDRHAFHLKSGACMTLWSSKPSDKTVRDFNAAKRQLKYLDATMNKLEDTLSAKERQLERTAATAARYNSRPARDERGRFMRTG